MEEFIIAVIISTSSDDHSFRSHVGSGSSSYDLHDESAINFEACQLSIAESSVITEYSGNTIRTITATVSFDFLNVTYFLLQVAAELSG